MNPFQCFMKKIEAGIVNRELGLQLADVLEEYEKEYLRRGKRADEAARRAAMDTADDALRIAARKADLALSNIEAQLNVLRTQARFEEVLGQRREEGKAPLWLKDPRKSPLLAAMRALLGMDRTELVGTHNVHYTAQEVRGEAQKQFRDGIEALRPSHFGLKEQTALELEVLQAIKDKGAQVSEPARHVAEIWAKTAEWLRTEFVAARGALPFREGWGMPNPVHDTLKVRTTPREEWIDFIKARIDKNDMLDFETGRRIMPKKLDRLLGEMYDTVAAGGLDGPTSAARGQGALAGRRALHRFISFKDASSWLEYDQKFGSGAGVYHTMMQHIENMAEDIAMLRVFGANPEATKRFIHSLFELEPARMTRQASMADPKAGKQAYIDNSKIASAAASARKAFDNLWDEVTGANKVPVNIELAHVMSEARATLTGSQMGSAILSSLTDPALMAMTARFNDIPAMGVISRAIAGMATKDFELNATQLGLVADSVAFRLHQNDRFMSETIRTGRMARIASAVIAGSGLRRWSGVLRASFGMEFMAVGANRLGLGFADLSPEFRGMLERYGLDEAGWEVIRKATPNEPREGGKFLTGADIRALGTPEAEDAARRWMQAINSEMDYAVIEGNPETRALLYGQSRPGTPEGELRRAVGQYKSFPITFAMLHFSRAFARGFDGERLSHAALTFAAMWGMGMVAMQAKEIAKGRDPITMDPSDPKGLRAWGAAALQGGGFGVFGDFLFIDQTRQGNTFASTLAGPSFAFVEKALGDFLMANLQRAWKGEPTHFAGDALYVAAGVVPGNNVWYWRTTFQRAVIDQLALMIDDRAPQRHQRIEKEAEKTWGQRFWWEPGRVGPRQAPDLTAAFGR